MSTDESQPTESAEPTEPTEPLASAAPTAAPAAPAAPEAPMAPAPPAAVAPTAFAPVPRRPRLPWINPARRGLITAVGVVTALVLFGAGIGVGVAIGDDGHHRNGPGPFQRVGDGQGGAEQFQPGQGVPRRVPGLGGGAPGTVTVVPNPNRPNQRINPPAGSGQPAPTVTVTVTPTSTA
jgi:hypothetical protein